MITSSPQHGPPFADSLTGGADFDEIFGNAGNNVLVGEANNDFGKGDLIR